MTWDEILILLIMVMGLFAIDMLVAKFNLKAGRIVAVLTFFILFPLGLIAGVVALICMNSKGKQRKFSIIAFCKNVLFHAFLLGIILLYLIDMILLKIFPDATFPVVFLSICFSPVVIVFVAKALDCLRDIKRKPKKADVTTENRVNDPFIVNEKKEAAPTVALQKTDEGDSKKIKPDKPIEKANAPIQKAQDDNKVEKTKSQAENKPMVNTDNTKPNEKLVFYDEGKKFIKQEHSLYNLTGDCDICVYSLTPKGETSPNWLIVKVTQAGCMDRYLDDKAKVPKRCVAMVRMDYEEIGPRSLFNITRDLTLLLRQNIKKTIEFRFYEDDGLHPRRIDLNDFFSIEVDSNSKEPGAEIYLRDKEHFLSNDNETEVTEPQTTQTEDKNKNSELYQRYQQYIKNHPYMSYTEFLKEEESNERAYFQGKTWY